MYIVLEAILKSDCFHDELVTEERGNIILNLMDK